MLTIFVGCGGNPGVGCSGSAPGGTGGFGLGTTAGELRKAMANRLGMVENQKLLNYNLGDLVMPLPDYRWRPLYTGSISFVYHSIIGPFSLGAYYYDKKESPWSFLFNYGFILFNSSPRE